MSASPTFATTPRQATANIAAANTNRDGTTGAYVTGFTAGSNGSRVDNIRACAAVTTTAGVLRIWIHDGTNRRLMREVLVSAITPGTGTAAWSYETWFTGENALYLPAGYHIDFTMHNNESMNVFINGGDL